MDDPNLAKLDHVRERYNEIYYRKAKGLNCKWREMNRYGNFTVEQKRTIADLFARYLSNARARGKDISTYVKRQPYYLAAVLWGVRVVDPEYRAAIKHKAWKIRYMKRWYTRIMNHQARKRVGKRYGYVTKGGVKWLGL